MNIDEEIRDGLQGDSTLMSLLTGGVYVEGETGRNGINPGDNPSAYTDAGYLKPHAIVGTRSATPWGGINDPDEGITSARTMVQIAFYDDGDLGYNTIEQAKHRVYQLLHDRRIGESRIKWTFDAVGLRDQARNNAALIRSDYQAVSIRKRED